MHADILWYIGRPRTGYGLQCLSWVATYKQVIEGSTQSVRVERCVVSERAIVEGKAINGVFGPASQRLNKRPNKLGKDHSARGRLDEAQAGIARPTAIHVVLNDQVRNDVLMHDNWIGLPLNTVIDLLDLTCRHYARRVDNQHRINTTAAVATSQ